MILGAVVIDLNAMIFGLPIAIFPVLAIEMFGVGPAEVGFLAAARGGGAMVAALLSGWVRTMDRTGRAVLASVGIYAGVTVAVGWPGLPFVAAIPFVAVAGAADLFSAVLRNTIIQSITDDEFRGRVSAAHGLATQSGPRIGDLRAALMTEAYGARAAVVRRWPGGNGRHRPGGEGVPATVGVQPSRRDPSRRGAGRCRHRIRES